MLKWHDEYLANSDFGFPLIPMMGICMCSTIGIKRSSSSVCPEFEIASTTSSCVITPKSPWNTSRGLVKNEGVPVLESVAAIFAPMWPLLPTPVTITFPLQFSIRSTALSKLSSSCGISPNTASASSFIACIAISLDVFIFIFNNQSSMLNVQSSMSLLTSDCSLLSSSMLAASLKP